MHADLPLLIIGIAYAVGRIAISHSPKITRPKLDGYRVIGLFGTRKMCTRIGHCYARTDASYTIN